MNQDNQGIVIGLTGGIGTGKSTVAGILKGLGLKLINADQIGHQLLTPGTEVYYQLIESFGREILSPEGEIDRKVLGGIVFSDAKKRQILNNITHPAIKTKIMGEIGESRSRGEDVVVEIPLLFEAKLESLVDEIWVVAVSSQTQIQRVMVRNSLSQIEAVKRISAQMPLAQKIALADVVINNEGTLEELREKVKQIWVKTKKRNN